MTQKSIQKQVVKILGNMGIADKALTSKASFIKDLGLDSLDFAELVLELETAFSVEIPITEAEKLETLQETVRYINNKLN